MYEHLHKTNSLILFYNNSSLKFKKTYLDFNSKKKEFEDSFTRLKVILPQVNIPKITTIVSGFYNDVVVVDNNIIIGLDYLMMLLLL